MYNPNVTLVNQSIDPVWAKLERLDGKGVYDFLLNPEDVTWQHQADYSKLPVLYTAQPLVSYKSSSTSLSLPRVLFWTPNHNADLTNMLATLKAMTKPPSPGQPIPLLKLTWGQLSQPRLYLVGLTIKEKQWRSGKVTQADGSMEFVIVPEIPKTQVQAIPKASPTVSPKPTTSSTPSTAPTATPKTTPSTTFKLTDREREAYKAKVIAQLKADQNLVNKYRITDINSALVRDDGYVVAMVSTGFNQVVAKLSDILIPASIKPGHRGKV